jgi:hypothetical protein
MPEFIEPQLATLATKTPSGPQWVVEAKFGGYRAQVPWSGARSRSAVSNGPRSASRCAPGPQRATIEIVRQPREEGSGLPYRVLPTVPKAIHQLTLAKVNDLEHPDVMRFDLDPGAGIE